MSTQLFSRPQAGFQNHRQFRGIPGSQAASHLDWILGILLRSGILRRRGARMSGVGGDTTSNIYNQQHLLDRQTVSP